MKPDAADNSVPREISSLLSKERVILRETQRAVTPPRGVTARCVSRRIPRSFDNRELISRGTELSAASGFISLLSQMSTRKHNAELRNSGLASSIFYNRFWRVAGAGLWQPSS